MQAIRRVDDQFVPCLLLPTSAHLGSCAGFHRNAATVDALCVFGIR